MSCRPDLPHAADANQARASDPTASAWVSANAGTGKTEVLVRRVLRLLLAGFEPQRILCLTYTKMAAAEMQNRLLGDLAAWATMAEGKLRESLKRLLVRDPEDTERKRRGGFLPGRSRPKAGSRSTPSTVSASGCYNAFPSRQTSRRILVCSKSRRRCGSRPPRSTRSWRAGPRTATVRSARR